MFNTFFTN